MAEIVLKGVGKQFAGGRKALEGINLRLPKGEFLAVLGPSGSGKSTLLRILAGLVAPTSGRVTFDGRDAATLAPRDRDAAIVFQNHSLFPHLRLDRNLAFSAIAAGVKQREALMSAKTVANALGLGDRLDARPSQLSGGQKQRAALGRVMVRRPSLLLLDEPFSNLDPPLRAAMVEDLRALHRSLGPTIVLVTHEPREAASLADRLAFLSEGRLAQVGPPEDFAQRPATEEVARFFAPPTMRREI